MSRRYRTWVWLIAVSSLAVARRGGAPAFGQAGGDLTSDRTPLMRAAAGDLPEMAVLLDRGAKSDARSARGRFDSPKGGFRIEFPGPFESSASTTQGGRAVRASRFAKGEPYLEAGELLYDKPEEARDAFREQAGRMREPGKDAELLATREVAPAPGWQGLEAVTRFTFRNVAPTVERKRLYFDGDRRLITLRVSAEVDDPREAADSFFRSFALIPIGGAAPPRAGAGAPQPVAPHWQAFRPAKFGLALDLPAKPSEFEDGLEGEFKSLAVDADLGPVHYRMFWTESEGDDPEADARSSHEESLKNIRGLGAVVKADAPVALGAWRGRSFVTVDDFAEPPKVERQWVLHDGARQTVRLSVAGPKDADSEENAAHFFASFRAPGLAPQERPAAVERPASPVAPKGDPRVREALDRSKLKYSVTPRGAFRLEYGLEGGRTQLVIVESETNRLGALEVREVWSVSLRSEKGGPSAEVLARLLRDSSRKKLGAWQLVPRGEGSEVIFCAEIPADCTAEVLKAVLDAVVQTADAMEKELTGKDDF